MVKYHIYFHNSSNLNKQTNGSSSSEKLHQERIEVQPQKQTERGKKWRLTFKQNVTACRLSCYLPVQALVICRRLCISLWLCPAVSLWSSWLTNEALGNSSAGPLIPAPPHCKLTPWLYIFCPVRGSNTRSSKQLDLSVEQICICWFM